MYIYPGQTVIYTNTSRTSDNPWFIGGIDAICGMRAVVQPSQNTDLESQVRLLFEGTVRSGTTNWDKVTPLYPAGTLVRINARCATVVEENDGGDPFLNVYVSGEPCHRKVSRQTLRSP